MIRSKGATPETVKVPKTEVEIGRKCSRSHFPIIKVSVTAASRGSQEKALKSRKITMGG